MDTAVEASLRRLGTVAESVTSSLYDTSTARKQRLVSYVKTLCQYICLKEKMEFKVLWPLFSLWVKDNPQKTTNYATIYLSDFIVANTGKMCMKVAIKPRLLAYKRWGIEIADDLKKRIDQLGDEWTAILANRETQNLEDKNHQTRQLIKYWPQIMSLLILDHKTFIEKADEVGFYTDGDTHANGRNNLISRSWRVLRRHTRQRVIQGHLLMTRAVLSLGRQTGARAKNILKTDIESSFMRVVLRYQPASCYARLDVSNYANMSHL